jgi:hypothetical protein
MEKMGRNGVGNGVAEGGYEETLRLIAGLPAPEGLEERVHAALRRAPRAGRVLAWPAALRLEGGWMRAAAAAAIVAVVAGGGWGVVRHVQPGQTAGGSAVMPHMAAPGGFSTGGAMRTPQTLHGPVAPVLAAPKAGKPAAARHGKTADADGKTPGLATARAASSQVK